MNLKKSLPLLILAFSLVAVEVQAERNQGELSAWRWSLENRIAVRLDPKARAARMQAAQAEQGSTFRLHGTFVAPVDTIAGSRHPELLLPAEIFRHFMSGAYLASVRFRDNYRTELTSKLDNYELPSNLFQLLDGMVADYVKAEEARRALMTASASAVSRVKYQRLLRERNQETCRSLALALDAALEQFGDQRLLSFLYGAVAPEMILSVTHHETADELYRLARGCK